MRKPKYHKVKDINFTYDLTEMMADGDHLTTFCEEMDWMDDIFVSKPVSEKQAKTAIEWYEATGEPPVNGWWGGLSKGCFTSMIGKDGNIYLVLATCEDK